MHAATPGAEWLEPDGLGGFASGTAALVRTRRYHALLLAATQPPAGRMVLVNWVEVTLTTSAGSYPLSAQRYTPDVTTPAGWRTCNRSAGNPGRRGALRFPTARGSSRNCSCATTRR